MYEVFWGKTCLSYNNMFTKVNTVHMYTRDTCYNFFLPSCRKSSRHDFISFQGSFVWNTLPKSIKLCNSIHGFKSQLKYFMLQNYI
jgi:hypothetical protein